VLLVRMSVLKRIWVSVTGMMYKGCSCGVTLPMNLAFVVSVGQISGVDRCCSFARIGGVEIDQCSEVCIYTQGVCSFH